MQQFSRLKNCRRFLAGIEHRFTLPGQAANLCTLRSTTSMKGDVSAGTPCLRLGGKVAIVTGGASGIGEATCRLFAAEGAKVVIADIDDDRGQKLQHELGELSSYRHCNVSIESEVASTVDFALGQYGALHVMFNNAGITDGGHIGVTLAQLSMEEYNRIMDVNVKGVVHGIKYAARAMQAGGSIICTGSVNSKVAMGNNHVYTIAKHAVVGIVKTAALELGAKGVRVNALSPSVVVTPMVITAFEKFAKTISSADIQQVVQKPENMPLQGVGGLSSHDVATAALFLASDESRFVNGHNLLIDGGLTSSRSFSF